MSLTEDIKDIALDLGYNKVGITSAEGFPDYAVELRITTNIIDARI